MSLGGDGLGTTVQSYGTSFRQYHWHTLARVESFQRLLHEVALLRRARCLCREHSDSKFGSSFKEVVTAANPASGVSSIQGSEMSTDELLQLKTECYKWWRLVREDFDRCAERCPHGMPIESCVDDQCARLVLAASNAELVECDAQVRREREASGLSNDMLLGHIGASVAGVELDMQDFAMAAFHLVYRAILLRAPARPVVPKIYKPIAVRLVNPIDPLLEEEETARRREAKSKARNSGLKLVIGVPCRPLYSHLHLRAAQYSLQRRLAQGFLMVQGGSRSRCFHLLAPNSTNHIHTLLLSLSLSLIIAAGLTGTGLARCMDELERNSTGPARSLPPLVLVRGPPGSGRTRLLAHFSLHSARCSSERDLVRHLTSSKFASHYSSARLPFRVSGYSRVPSHAA